MHFRLLNTGRKAYRLIEPSIATVVFSTDTGSASAKPADNVVDRRFMEMVLCAFVLLDVLIVVAAACLTSGVIGYSVAPLTVCFIRALKAIRLLDYY